MLVLFSIVIEYALLGLFRSTWTLVQLLFRLFVHSFNQNPLLCLVHVMQYTSPLLSLLSLFAYLAALTVFHFVVASIFAGLLVGGRSFLLRIAILGSSSSFIVFFGSGLGTASFLS